MNNKDKEAFVKWYSEETANVLWEDFNGDEIVIKAWQSACEYKKLEYKAQIETSEIAYKSNQKAAVMSAILSDKNRFLQTENKKLREALEKAHEDFTRQGLHKQASRVLLALNITTAREALKEVGKE